jgi:hypothetical protein
MRNILPAACAAFWLITATARADAATLLRIDGSSGDFIGQGVVDVFDESDGTFTVERQDSRSFVLGFKGDGNIAYGLEFVAPEGAALEPGNY